MQSKYINENGRPKRIKRKAATRQEAIKSCKLALKAWEKEFERGRNTKIDKIRTFVPAWKNMWIRQLKIEA